MNAEAEPERAARRTRLLQQLHALNMNLDRLGVPPLFTDDAAEALAEENLSAAVAVTGDYLPKVAREVRGL